jgi:NADH:ubiquinone oxidoreductase subunit C
MIDIERLEALLRGACAPAEARIHTGHDGECYASVPATCLVRVIEALVAEGLLHHLSAITGLDEGADLSVLYHLWLEGGLTLRVCCPREAPALTSLAGLLPAALWYEREVHDLFGIVFEGHPALEPLLTPEDWHGPPPLLRQAAP